MNIRFSICLSIIFPIYFMQACKDSQPNKGYLKEESASTSDLDQNLQLIDALFGTLDSEARFTFCQPTDLDYFFNPPSDLSGVSRPLSGYQPRNATFEVGWFVGTTGANDDKITLRKSYRIENPTFRSLSIETSIFLNNIQRVEVEDPPLADGEFRGRSPKVLFERQ